MLNCKWNAISFSIPLFPPQQRNFKQKIVSLLKRFRPEELEGDVRRGQGVLRGERDLDALFQELESLSCGEGEESGQDIDSISIGSTPKPSLRPFFNSKQDSTMGKHSRKVSTPSTL